MTKTWGAVKQECIDLGFEKAQAYQKNANIFLSAVNRAIAEIATYKPNVEKLVIQHTEGSMHDLAVLTAVGGNVVFKSLADRKPQDAEYNAVPYDIDRSNLRLLAPDGEYYVWYERYPAQITDTTTDDEAVDLDYSVTPLIPLLASFYIWLDDTERKATIYYNRYDDMKNQIMGKEQRLIKIVPNKNRRWVE